MSLSGMLRIPFLRRNGVLVAVGYAATAISATATFLTVSAPVLERNGLHRTVYSQVGFQGRPILDNVSDTVTLDFLGDSPDLPWRFFSVRWQGYWYLPEPTTINLHGSGDDRLDVWVDGELVMRRRAPAEMRTQVRSLSLEAGAHHLVVEYEQYGGRADMRLAYSLPDSFFGGPEGPLPPHYLFPGRPTLDDVRSAWRAVWFERLVLFVWIAPAFLGAAFAMRRISKFRADLEAYALTHEGYWQPVASVATGIGVAIITLGGMFGRLPGWNPGSLSGDDLVYATIIRSDLWSMLTAPIPVAPGLFVIWSGFYELFPDPEWSLQVLPLGCAIASVPVMALAVRNLTKDRNLSLVAAGLAALNPLLATYSMTVHAYSFDFLVTALFLLAAVMLFADTSRVDPGRFAKVALAGGIAPLFSVPSVFITFSIMHVGALHAIRDWRLDRSRAVRILGATATYDLAVLACYFLLRSRTNETLRGSFADGFMPLNSLSGAGGFLTTNGQRLLEMGQTELWLPLIGLGCLWLFARRSWRTLGLIVVGFYAAFLLASAFEVYPLGTGRTDIFAFPVGILCLASGAHLVTAALPATRLFRLAIALAVTAALVWSPTSDYGENVRNDVPLVKAFAANERPDDGVIMTRAASFLIAFYGQWPLEVAADDQAVNGTQVRIDRSNTLHLPPREDRIAEPKGHLVQRFLRTFSGRRVWFVAYREATAWREVTQVLERSGYAVDEMLRTSRGTLFVAVRRDGTRP
ncbi:MAG: hypothetical protein F4169_09185 [Gammaproteobacteria bacterium]|nr:hypothetical protein [Gammaproteobacteria bacterium]